MIKDVIVNESEDGFSAVRFGFLDHNHRLLARSAHPNRGSGRRMGSVIAVDSVHSSGKRWSDSLHHRLQVQALQ